MIKQANRKEQTRKRHERVRLKIKGTTESPRLAVYRSTKHIYAQLIDDVNHKTIKTYYVVKDTSVNVDSELSYEFRKCLMEVKFGRSLMESLEIPTTSSKFSITKTPSPSTQFTDSVKVAL